MKLCHKWYIQFINQVSCEEGKTFSTFYRFLERFLNNTNFINYYGWCNTKLIIFNTTWIVFCVKVILNKCTFRVIIFYYFNNVITFIKFSKRHVNDEYVFC